MKKRIVVVTTDKDRRGVFYGELLKQDAGVVVLKNARMAVSWSNETHGVLGLASIGPQEGSRISPIVPQIELNGVTAVIDCTKRAVAVWETEPWN